MMSIYHIFNTNPFDRTSWYALSDKFISEFQE